MLRLLVWLAGALFLLLLAAGGLFLGTLEARPLVDRPATVTPQAIAQARLLLLTNDPRRMQAGEARRTAIPAALLDQAFNYAATRFLNGRAALKLDQGRTAELQISLRLPWASAAGHLNVAASLGDAAGPPRIEALRFGPLNLPAPLAEPLLDLVLAGAGYGKEWQLARRAIRETRFEAGQQRVILSYVWQPALLEHARALAVPPAEHADIRAAQGRLTELLAERSPGSSIPLTEVLGPMLKTDMAAGQSRAALLVLAAYMAERNLATLLPEAADWPRPPPLALTLGGRYDSAQHFVISAALAVWAGEPLAEAIGTYKELADARHGYGFSFADLAADRSGTAFGEQLLKESPLLRSLLAGELRDADLLPALDGLPEYLRQNEFRRRYGGPGNPAYERLLGEVEQRVMALPLYRRNGTS